MTDVISEKSTHIMEGAIKPCFMLLSFRNVLFFLYHAGQSAVNKMSEVGSEVGIQQKL